MTGRTATTGGVGAGEAAARTVSLAAEVLRAIARASRDWAGAGGASAQADALLRRAEALAAENAAAFARVTEALVDPGAEHAVVLSALLADAAAVPGRIAAAAGDVAELAVTVASEGPPDRRVDAAACAALAEGAAAAVALLVAVNLAVGAGDERRGEADAAVAVASRAAVEARRVVAAEFG